MILWEKGKLCAENKVTVKVKKKKNILEESDNSNNISSAGATTWVLEDKMPNLGPFTGIQGWNKFSLTQQKCQK
jgi:hypothetical protein